MKKIFTIGDSISQGFMSGAAAKTELSYSTIIAEALKIENYNYHKWEEHKLKFDLEKIFRALDEKYGSDIRFLEWIGATKTISDILDEAEDYYERGHGKIGKSINQQADYYDNCAVEGMDIGDAWMVTPKICFDMVRLDGKSSKDNWFSTASEPFYRNAYRVLNPNAKAEFNDYSAISWLEHVASNEGIENVLVWLGANNALGTIFNLKINQTPGDGKRTLEVNRKTRQEWNLWHPKDFKAEYSELINRITDALTKNKCLNYNVFLGTVPLVTIAPLLRGFGEERLVRDPSGRTQRDFRYYQYYTYFPLADHVAIKSDKVLKFSEALFIDKTIIEFNKIIKELVDNKNADLGRKVFNIVEVSDALTDLAWKRNSGAPPYQLPETLKWFYPPIDTKYYNTTPDGKITAGGFFSLDGVHPTAIGQGIIASEFLKIMNEVNAVDNGVILNWEKIIADDTLRNKPLTNIGEMYQHEKIIELIINVYKAISIKD
jgi:hypothetical protein